MDEYKRFYYNAHPPAQYVQFGDIEERVKLRKQLQCKPFRWYMENVYPELKSPNVGSNRLSKQGALRQEDQCLDTLGNANFGHISLYHCHGQGANQAWEFTIDGQLRHDNLCVTVSGFEPGRPIVLSECIADDTQVCEIHNNSIGPNNQLN